MLTDAEIAKRIEAVQAARRAKGDLTPDDLTAIIGPSESAARTHRMRDRSLEKEVVPRCTELVLKLASSFAEVDGRVCLADIAKRIGVSGKTVSSAARALKAQGRWPYVVRGGKLSTFEAVGAKRGRSWA